MRPEEVQIIYYHSPCQDGLASAWVAHNYAIINDLKYELRGIQNNTKSSSKSFNVASKKPFNILFLDYAPTDNEITQMNKYGHNYYILDHHKTNAERLARLSSKNVLFNMDKSGVGLAWDFFYPDIAIPLFLQMIEDRDLWRWTIPNSRPFCDAFYTLTTFTTSDKAAFELFDTMHTSPEKVDELINIGELLEKKKMQQVKYIADFAIRKTYNYNGLKVCIVNCTHEIGSDLGNYILDEYPSVFDFVVCWRYSHTDEEYWYSLRSAKSSGVDVGAISRKIDPNGGGHAGAAGCSSKIHPSTLFNHPS